MSFHAAGTNVGDTCNIQLPPWVLREGAANPDIFYTDAAGFRNRECLSTGCLHEPVLAGRTPLQARAPPACSWGPVKLLVSMQDCQHVARA